MWIKTLLGAGVKVRRDVFVIHFVERELTIPTGHEQAAGRDKRCYMERQERGGSEVGKGGIYWVLFWERAGLASGWTSPAL